jgi:hypothetical protein
MLIRRLLLIIALLLLSCQAWAETYWVSPTGTAAWTSCKGSTPLSGTSACSLRTANLNITAGNTVYLRGGTSSSPLTYNVGSYSSTSIPGVAPTHSGTAENPIIYSVYGDEYIVFDGQAESGVYSIGIYINGYSYIKVTGRSKWQWKMIQMSLGINIGPRSGNVGTADSSYNEISYIWVYDGNKPGYHDTFKANVIWYRAYYNHVHDCKFEELGKQANENSGADTEMFVIGGEAAWRPSTVTSYNIVENCEFAKSGHSSAFIVGKYNIFRNNYAHNEPWISLDGNLYSYRVGETNGVLGYVGMNLIEGNRIAYGGPTMYGDATHYYYGGVGWKHAASDYIFRYNAFFNNQAVGIALYPQCTDCDRVSYNYLYNNTFYHNGHYIKPTGDYTTYNNAITLNHQASSPYNYYNWVHHNVIKNNLFYDNGNVQPSSSYKVFSFVQGTREDSTAMSVGKGYNVIENNFNDDYTEYKKNDDPLFISTDTSDPTSFVLPNFNLNTGSKAIDYGTSYLTTATNSGSSSTTLTVSDANYFQDGKFGQADASRIPASVSNLYPDEIAIGNSSNTVAISKIYSKLTLGVAPSIAWSVGNTITGNISGATAVVVAKVSDTEYTVRDFSGSGLLAYFLPGEVLSNGTYSANQNSATTLNITLSSAPSPSSWYVGSTVTGRISGASCTISQVVSSTNYICTNYTANTSVQKVFSSETLTDAAGGVSGGNEATLSSSYRGDYYPKIRNSNTIILATAKNWSTSDPIWLYKKSDAEVVLYDAGTDAGAYEYTGSISHKTLEGSSFISGSLH